MDGVLDELTRYAARCGALAKAFVAEEVTNETEKLIDVVRRFDKAWSGSFLGYQSKIYTTNFDPVRPGQHFDSEWGTLDLYSNQSSGDWSEYDYEYVIDRVYSNAGIQKPTKLHDLAKLHRDDFHNIKEDVLPILDALKKSIHDDAISERIEDIRQLKDSISTQAFFKASLPKGQVMVRDPRAMQGGGFVCPPHLAVEIELFHLSSYGTNLGKLQKKLRSIVPYLEVQQGISENTVAKRDGKIFIGHGASSAWRDLKDFIN